MRAGFDLFVFLAPGGGLGAEELSVFLLLRFVCSSARLDAKFGKKIRSFSTLVLGLELGIIGDSVVLINAALCCSCWILVREWSSGLQFPKENGEKILGVDWKLWWTSW